MPAEPISPPSHCFSACFAACLRNGSIVAKATALSWALKSVAIAFTTNTTLARLPSEPISHLLAELGCRLEKMCSPEVTARIHQQTVFRKLALTWLMSGMLHRLALTPITATLGVGRTNGCWTAAISAVQWWMFGIKSSIICYAEAVGYVFRPRLCCLNCKIDTDPTRMTFGPFLGLHHDVQAILLCGIR